MKSAVGKIKKNFIDELDKFFIYIYQGLKAVDPHNSVMKLA
jgi:hypothetical protein